MRILISVMLLAVSGGCAGRYFTNLGNNVGVPAKTIDQYAATRGITRAEARARLRAESDAEPVQGVQGDAKKHGVCEDEAKGSWNAAKTRNFHRLIVRAIKEILATKRCQHGRS